MNKFVRIISLLFATSCIFSCSSEEDSIPEGVIMPISLTDGEIVDFFKSELPVMHHSDDYYLTSYSFFYDSIAYGGMAIKEDLVYVINSRQELSDIYLGKKELPSIDFEKYTLIIGQQIMPCLGFYVAKKELLIGDNGLVLNLYARNDWEILPTALQNLYFWDLYPKQSEKTITVNLNKEYTYFPEGY